jgi:methionine-rich copper-binding protein CopC
MIRSFSIATVVLVLAAPALAQHAGHGTAVTPAMDHSKMDHSKMNHGSMNHGQMQHGGAQNSMLKSSTPANGAVLQGSPATLALSFAHPVVLQNVTLVNAAGKTTKVAVPATAAATDTYQLKLPKLGKGAYTVNWNAGGQHVMSGRLSFQVR